MESKKYVIAMDQGTTSSRAILFNKRGEIQSSQQREFRQIFPKPGWVEHDPMEIWSTQMGVAMEAMQKIDARPEDIAAIGITNQRETTVIWDAATGRPVYNAIVWQCRRTSDIIDKLKSDGLSGYVQEKTGLIPDAYFSASKIAWILRNVPGVKERARRGELRFGTVDSWLIWNLTAGMRRYLIISAYPHRYCLRSGRPQAISAKPSASAALSPSAEPQAISRPRFSASAALTRAR